VTFGVIMSHDMAPAVSSFRPATSERILDAAYQRISDTGLSRTTVEDVARQAGLTRQTIYRYFPSKDDLVRALLMREEERLLDGVRAVFAGSSGLAEALTESMVFGVLFAHDHPVLDRLLQTDAETTLPYVTTRAGSMVDRAREVLAGLIRRRAWVRPALVEPVSDLLVRAFISYTLTPSHRPPEEMARDLARIATAALTPEKEAKRR
jgi:AcrR family transcriptional regulator